MKAFNFKIEHINFLISIRKQGLLSHADGEKMLKIYRETIDPEYPNFCLSCGETLRLEFKRLESIVLTHYNKQAMGAVLTLLEGQAQEKAKKAVKVIESEQEEDKRIDSDLSRMTKKEIIKEVKDKTGEEINPKTKREALEIASKILNN